MGESLIPFHSHKPDIHHLNNFTGLLEEVNMTELKMNEVYEKAKSKVLIIGKTALERIFTLARIFKRYCDSTLTLKLDTSSKLKISLLIPIALSYFMFPFDVIPGK